MCGALLLPVAEAEVSTERARALEHLLVQDCGSCHGLTLKGGLGPALTQDRMSVQSVDAIQQIILHGVPGTAMPPWLPLISAEDGRWLAERLVKGVVPDEQN